MAWDGGSNHKGEPIRKLLARFTRLSAERLPAYGPHLNLVRQLWACLKHGRMADFVPSGVGDVHERVREHLADAKADPRLLRRLSDGSELPFPDGHSQPEGQ